MIDRSQVVHQNFIDRLKQHDLPTRQSTHSLEQTDLTHYKLIELFESQVLSRQLDRVAKQLQAQGEGFYTIGSSGHENMAAIAAAFRLSDMAFLHYRDAAFQIQRSKKLPGQTPAWDMLLSFTASADDPISGGRHKVLGSLPLFIPPQTSTIASHLPKAVGTAYSIGLSQRQKPLRQKLPNDAVVLCSFGDASANHSTTQGAINSASWTAYQGVPMPLVFICEDNGIGISTQTPSGWIEAAFCSRPGLKYVSCNGLDVLETYQTACEVAQYVRATRKPVFLHLRCVRLYGHAGADTPSAYLSREEIEKAERNDPLLYTAAALLQAKALSYAQMLNIYENTESRLLRIAKEAVRRPKLETTKQLMESLIPPSLAIDKAIEIDPEQRQYLFGRDIGEMKKPHHMARLISWALADLMMEHGEIILMGEDIGPKGGVYNVTAKLHARFGARRVINTLLDEQSILGLAMGLAHNGFLPIPEIQFLAYLHNAEDQLRGEAATLSFFSKGQYTNPMIIRVAGLGYQKGFGGHFHNDNSLAVLRDIPGIIIACPSNGVDAVNMLRECARLALEEQRVIVFIEPIALYMTRDLHEPGDGMWSCNYPPPQSQPVSIADIGLYGDGTELAIISYANGYYLSRQAEKLLSEQHGIKLRLIDLRWLAPLPESAILDAIRDCDKVLIVDECRQTGSQSEALMCLLHEHRGSGIQLKRITAEDSFIALGKAATITLPSRDSILQAALELLNTRP
jgi:2-oxoisovalerate dehydrogenase E1 component